MQNRFLVFLMMAFLSGGTMFMTSCSDNNELSEEVLGNFVDGSVDGIDRKCMTGRRGCFEFVFPITITFEDETTANPESYDDLKEIVTAWKEANPDATERPDISFPIEIMTADGELATIADQDALKEVAKECRSGMRPGNGRHGICFKLIFPVEIMFADGSILSAETKGALKTALRTWKANNPDGERPTLVYPVEIEFRDGTTAEVATSEGLAAIKEACREDDSE